MSYSESFIRSQTSTTCSAYIGQRSSESFREVVACGELVPGSSSCTSVGKLLVRLPVGFLEAVACGELIPGSSSSIWKRNEQSQWETPPNFLSWDHSPPNCAENSPSQPQLVKGRACWPMHLSTFLCISWKMPLAERLQKPEEQLISTYQKRGATHHQVTDKILLISRRLSHHYNLKNDTEKHFISQSMSHVHFSAKSWHTERQLRTKSLIRHE